MRRNEYTITVKNGYFGNTAISAVRLDNNISVYHFTLSGRDVFPGCTYQVQYERPDGKSALSVPENQVFHEDGSLTFDWTPSGDAFAVAGEGSIKIMAVSPEGNQMWNSHLMTYHVCETIDPTTDHSVQVPTDELATAVAKAIDCADKASQSADSAQESARQAEELKNQTASYTDQIHGYKEDCGELADKAEQSASEAKVAETNAKDSATDAKNSLDRVMAGVQDAYDHFAKQIASKLDITDALTVTVDENSEELRFNLGV